MKKCSTHYVGPNVKLLLALAYPVALVLYAAITRACNAAATSSSPANERANHAALAET